YRLERNRSRTSPRDQVFQPRRCIEWADLVCWNETTGRGHHHRAVQTDGDALCHGTVAGRHSHEFQDDSEPARTTRGTGTDTRQRASALVLEEDDLDPQPRAPQDRA